MKRYVILTAIWLLLGCYAQQEEAVPLRSWEGVPRVDCTPEFSWDTLPLYIHVRKSTDFDAGELDYLASFPLITFEKTTGMRTHGSSDAGTLAAARAVKALNPKARVLYYRNVFVHYPWYSFDRELDRFDQPFLRDRGGKGKLVRGNAEAYDLSQPEVVDWWVRTAADLCADPAIDGLFLDGNLKVLVPYLKDRLNDGKKDAVTAVYPNMIARTRQAIPPGKLMIANIIRAQLSDSGLGYLEAFDGSYLENFDTSTGTMSKVDYMAKGIEAVQTAARKGKIIAFTLGLADAIKEANGIDDTRIKLQGLEGLQPRIDFCIAMYLICAEKYSYLYLHDGYAVDLRDGECMSKLWLKRLPEYVRPLGPPKGPATRRGYLYTREFEHVSVLLDLETETGTIIWHPE